MRQGRLEGDPKCPQCGETLDGFSAQHDQVPAPGDVTVCIYCTTVLGWTCGMMLSVLPQEELEQLPQGERDFIAKAIQHFGVKKND